MGIKVMIAFSNRLFSAGICKLIEGYENIEVVDVFELGFNPIERIRRFGPDIILVDFMTLYNVFGGPAASCSNSFILFDTFCGDKNLIAAANQKGMKGILPGDSTPELLKEAIHAVAKGGRGQQAVFWHRLFNSEVQHLGAAERKI